MRGMVKTSIEMVRRGGRAVAGRGPFDVQGLGGRGAGLRCQRNALRRHEASWRWSAGAGTGFGLTTIKDAVRAVPADRHPLAGQAPGLRGPPRERDSPPSPLPARIEMPVVQVLAGARRTLVVSSSQDPGGRSRWGCEARFWVLPVQESRMGRGMATGRWAELLNSLGSTLSGNAFVVGSVATALVWSSTQDAIQSAQVAAMGAFFVGLLSPTVQGMLRRTAVARSLSRFVSRMEPRSRLAFRGVHAARSALTCNNSLRDDIFALRKAMKPILARHDVCALLGDNVQLGKASLMREIRLEGDRMVEAIFKLHGRDNSAWREGWSEGDIHVVADGNSVRVHPVSMLLIFGERKLVVKGKGIEIDEGASPPDEGMQGLDMKRPTEHA